MRCSLSVNCSHSPLSLSLSVSSPGTFWYKSCALYLTNEVGPCFSSRCEKKNIEKMERERTSPRYNCYETTPIHIPSALLLHPEPSCYVYVGDHTGGSASARDRLSSRPRALRMLLGQWHFYNTMHTAHTRRHSTVPVELYRHRKGRNVYESAYTQRHSRTVEYNKHDILI